MAWTTRWRKRLRALVRKDAVERELEEELAYHLELETEKNLRAGMRPEEARRRAVIAFGGIEQYKEEVREARVLGRWADLLRQDVGYTFRTLGRSPGLALTIIVTLGLGIGANAAIFTALDRVFLQAPPGVVDPGAVRRLYAHNYSTQAPGYGPNGHVTPMLGTRELRDLREALQGTAEIVGDYLYRRGTLGPGHQRVLVTFVSSGYFEFLGVRPAQGRFFAPEENRFGPSVPVAVISHPFWRNHFGSAPDVLGRTVQVGGTTYEIIGVAPRPFEGLELEAVDLWVPLAHVPGGLDGATALRLLARVNRDTDPRALDQMLTAQYRRTHLGNPWVDDSSSIMTAPILAARGPGNARYNIPGMSTRSLELLPRLAGVSLVVMVIAVANVASLLLMRAIRRRREIAVRLALGVSRLRLAGQLVTESSILAVMAGGIALLIAAVTGKLLRSQLATFRWAEAVVDRRVIMVAMGIAIVGGIAAGLAPALFALRTDVGSSLKVSTGATRTGTTVRTTLLATQAALCMALLACAGAFLQSLRRAGDFDRGHDPDRTIVVSVPAYYPNADEEIALIAERLRRLPRVEAVGRTLTGLTGGIGLSAMVGTSPHDTVGIGPYGPSIDFVEPEFMRAAGLRVLDGRLLTASDNEPVAVVNQALATKLWPGARAVGSCIHIRQPRASPCRRVVGVVRDYRTDVTAPPVFRIYLPIDQAWTRPERSLIPNFLVVRTRTTTVAEDVALLRSTAVPILSGGDPDFSAWRGSELQQRELRPWRLAATLFLLLGGLGLVAAAAGMYGLVAYDVAQRTRELGIRITLGATSARILRLVVGAGLRVVLIGVAAGTVVALAFGRLVASLLFETSPYDPLILVLTGTILSGTAAIASFLPAWRATRVDPVVALSSE